MKHTKADLIMLSGSYVHNHGVEGTDVEKATFLSNVIERTRKDYPVSGDVFICKGPKDVIYENGHLDRNDPTDYSAICVRPYVSFTFADDGSGACFSTSGGYWFSIPKDKLQDIKYVGKRKKTFCAWGHCGACADGAFRFQAEVNVWEIYLESIY